MKITRIRITMSFVLALLIGCASGGGQPASEMTKGVVLRDGVVLTAEVVGIDRSDRVLKLRGPDDRVVSLEVSEEARNFDQIEIGDKVRAEYHESVALYLGKHGQKPGVAAGMVAARAAKGEKPAVAAVEAIDVSARIRAIDMANRSVTLELPDGSVSKTHVDPSIKAFDTLKVGDLIHARITEAIAISVEK
ncbi:MAG: hypothetical protein PVI39_12910 [Desulfobacteraceae bacterium]